MFHFFFFNDTATTEIYTLSLHDALPISRGEAVDLRRRRPCVGPLPGGQVRGGLAHREAGTPPGDEGDRKSTRLNSSHDQISYAVFCLKKKKHRKQAYATIRPADRLRRRL